MHPLTYKQLDKAQQQDPQIKNDFQKDKKNYHLVDFHRGGKSRSLVCYKDKIVVPKLLHKHVISWYHTLLCHQGINSTEESIAQHLWWSKMRDQITNYVSACPTCQRN